ncbi:MAG TPA: substrate-binding domain-containing protein [Steroidobacteraceae bacterium]|nr:substrate-binding domain-containing protein [Steroidobacteraceae bacterium]
MKGVCGVAALLLAGMLSAAAPETIVMASTTSTQDSGLFGYLLPIVRARTGVEVKVVAQGTGQALDTARRGDADVVFVHDPEAEQRFVAEGSGVARHPVMYNDFLIVGPAADPAGIRGSRDVAAALRAIARGQFPFVSRGDRSGTHQAELRLWSAADIEVDPARDRWYRSVGQGMGPALNMASASNAYVLTDRGTWISFRNKGSLQALVEGDTRLFNQYGLILVNPAKHPHVKVAAGQRVIDFLLSAEGQAAIGAFRVEGQQLFHPNASGTGQ